MEMTVLALFMLFIVIAGGRLILLVLGQGIGLEPYRRKKLDYGLKRMILISCCLALARSLRFEYH